jgi:hypothetical protein
VFGSEVLDVFIGILFIYLVLSLICSAIQELIASWLKMRAGFLAEGIRVLLDDPPGNGLARDFFNHPLVNSLFRGAYDPNEHRNLPSYIPARTFALAIMDIAAPPTPEAPVSGAAGATSAAPRSWGTGPSPLRLRQALGKSVLPASVTRALATLIDAAGDDPGKTRENIEHWYNSAMSRVASVYKQSTQIIILCIGLVVAAAVNADSIAMVTTLSTNKSVRDSLVAASAQILPAKAAAPASAASAPDAATSAPGAAGWGAATDSQQKQFDSCRANPNSAECRLDINLDRIRDSGLPFGWMRNAAPNDPRAVPVTAAGWGQKIVGILLTVAAISLGAPFWFDLLNKVTLVRSAIKPEENPKT